MLTSTAGRCSLCGWLESKSRYTRSRSHDARRVGSAARRLHAARAVAEHASRNPAPHALTGRPLPAREQRLRAPRPRGAGARTSGAAFIEVAVAATGFDTARRGRGLAAGASESASQHGDARRRRHGDAGPHRDRSAGRYRESDSLRVPAVQPLQWALLESARLRCGGLLLRGVRDLIRHAQERSASRSATAAAERHQRAALARALGRDPRVLVGRPRLARRRVARERADHAAELFRRRLSRHAPRRPRRLGAPRVSVALPRPPSLTPNDTRRLGRGSGAALSYLQFIQRAARASPPQWRRGALRSARATSRAPRGDKHRAPRAPAVFLAGGDSPTTQSVPTET